MIDTIQCGKKLGMSLTDLKYLIEMFFGLVEEEIIGLVLILFEDR
jgi:hypothetical protein